jgi:hypothetical protein
LGEIGFTDQAKDLLKLFGNIVNSITDILQGETIGSKFAKGLVKGIGGTLTPGLALVGAIFIKLFVDLAKFGVTSLKQILGINKAAQQQTALQQSILQTLLQNEAIQREIIALEGNKVAQEQLLLKIYNQQAAALARVSKAAATVTPGLFGAGLRGGPKGVTKRGAGGYISAESRDVSRGVGGAPASSKVVSIPNFAFGGGQRGTMVANTSEYFVPNYKGGGDAIFNKDMVKTMGLPSGAKKLNAAGGFIPNFAAPLLSSLSTRQLGRLKAGNNIRIDGQSYNAASFGATPESLKASGGIAPSIAARQAARKKKTIVDPGMFAMIVPNVTGLNQVKFGKKGTANEGLAFTVVGFKGKQALKAGVSNDEALDDATKKYALGKAFSEAKLISGNRPKAKKLEKLSNQGAISSLSGSIFETAVSSLLTAKAFDQNRDPNARFDFLGGQGLTKLFRLPTGAKFIEAKIRNSPDMQQSMFGKIRKQLGRASDGYIPNYAQIALEEAIMREEKAGVPINQIRINQSGKLRNAKNPKGLAVTNTRDEPTGKIPNFNKGDGLGSGGSLGLIFAAQAIAGAASAFVDLESTTGKLIGAFTTVLTSFATFSLVSPSIKDFSTKLTNSSKALKATTLTFDKSAKRFRNASGQFASNSAGRSMANRGRGFAAGAAAIGGRALGMLGPVAMIASVAIPLVMALKKTETGFSSLSKELDNIDLSKLSAGGSQLMAEFVKTIELNQEKRTQADKIKTDAKKAGVNLEGKTIDEILNERLGDLTKRDTRRTNKLVKDPDTGEMVRQPPARQALNKGELSFISPAMIAAVGFENVQSAIDQATESSGMGGNKKFRINQDKFLEVILEFAKATDAFKSAADGIKEANDKLIEDSGGSLILGDATKRLKANQRLGKATRISGLLTEGGGLFRDLSAMTESSKNIFKSQQMALKLAGNLGKLERERLAISKELVDFELKKNDASREMGANLASQVIKQVEGKVVEKEKLTALEDQLAAGADFETILDAVNKLATDKGIQDSESLTAVKDTVKSYKAQNNELEVSNALQKQLLDKRKEMANMSPLERANAQRRGDLKELTEDVPKRLADNLESSIGNALDNLATGTYDSIGDVFLNIALEFGKSLQKEINDAIAKSLVESFTSSTGGGGFLNAVGNFIGGSFGGSGASGAQGQRIIALNSGGLVTGGNGVTDDVPARLTGGEFVIRKSAVQKYGADFLDRLNNQSVNGMQTGGYVQGADNTRTGRFFDDPGGYMMGGARSRAYLEEAKKRDFFVPGQRGAGAIVGKENLLAFSEQMYTSGSTDVIAGRAGGASIDLEDQSVRLTAFARRRDSPANRALREAQGQAFGLYQQSVAEEQRVVQENRDAKTARRKAFQQAVVGAFVNATVAGVTAGLQNVNQGGSFFGPQATEKLKLGADFISQSGETFAAGTSIADIPGMTELVPQEGSFLGFKYTKNVLAPTVEGAAMLDATRSFGRTINIMPGAATMFNNPASVMNTSQGIMNTADYYNPFRVSNGGLMGAAGSNALLMDGEYVMGREAASSMGAETLNSINTLNYANGGSVGGSAGSSGGGADVGTVNIEINIDKEGGASSSASGSGEEDPQQAREFSQKIKDVVLNVINEEKRVSGSLFTRNK